MRRADEIKIVRAMALKSTSSSRVTSRPASTNGKPTSSSAPTSRRGSVDQGVVVAKPATKLASPSDKTNNENSKPIAVKEPEPQIILSGDDLAKMKAATDALSDIIEQGQIAAEELRVRRRPSHPLPRSPMASPAAEAAHARAAMTQATCGVRLALTHTGSRPSMLPKFTQKHRSANSKVPKILILYLLRSSPLRKPSPTSCRDWPSVGGGSRRTSRSRR